MYPYERLNVTFYLYSFIQFFIILTMLLYKKILPYSWAFFFNIMNNTNTSVDLTSATYNNANLEVCIFFEIKLLQFINFFFTLYFSCFALLQIFIIMIIRLNLIYRKSKFK